MRRNQTTGKGSNRPAPALRLVDDLAPNIKGADAKGADAPSSSEQDQARRSEIVLEEYDVTPLVGLRVRVFNAAIQVTDEEGDVTIELPKQNELLAAAAVERCLMPARLTGQELKAIRKILKLTLSQMAERLDDRTAPETVSRWEANAQPMGTYVEKVFRLVVCEELKDAAPGIDYGGKRISEMRLVECAQDAEPLVRLELVRLKRQSGVIDAWDTRSVA